MSNTPQSTTSAEPGGTTPSDTRGGRLAVLTLAFTLFVVTTSEFQVAAMLTGMADDLGTSVSHLGLLITCYSLGMALGGPLIAWALRTARPRRALPAVLGCYAALEGLASVTPDPTVLMLLRLGTGALSGATFGLVMAAALPLAPRDSRPKVVATILTGLMAGTLLGLPLSRLLAMAGGWRASFVVLAAAAALMTVAVLLTLPVEPAHAEESASAAGALRNAALWLRYGISFLTIGGCFAAFAFIDPLLGRAGIDGVGATVAMFGFGLAAFLVNTLGGRVSENRAGFWLTIGLIGQFGALTLFAFTGTSTAAVAVAVVLLGGTGIALNPLLVSRVLLVAPAQVLVNTVHTSAITLGVAAASAAGSSAIAVTTRVDATAWIGLGLTAAALALTLLTRETRQC